MLGTILAVVVIVLGFSLVLAKGGKDHTIRIKLSPASTKEGRATRYKLFGLLVVLGTASIIIAFGSGLGKEQAYFSVATFLVIAAFGTVRMFSSKTTKRDHKDRDTWNLPQ